MDCSTPGFPVHHHLLELTQIMSTMSVMPCNRLILCHPLLLLPSTFLSIRVFSKESVFPSGGQILEFQLQHQSFQWIFSTDFFRMDWLDLLAVQGTLKSLLQHHSSKESILWHSPSLWFNTFKLKTLNLKGYNTCKSYWHFVKPVQSSLKFPSNI